MLHDLLSIRRYFLFILPVAVFLAASVEIAQAQNSSTLFIYLEVPANYSPPSEMILSELTLKGADEAISVVPLRRHLVAGELAGTQVLLARTSIAAGYYDTLTIELGSVTTQAGVATVEPRIQPRGYPVFVDANLRENEATVVDLIWQPTAAPLEDRPYSLSIGSEHRVVPPLGSLAFVTERESGAVMVIDRLAGRVVDACLAGTDPRGMAYSSLSQKLYVAVAGEDGIGVIDGMTLRLERIVPLNFGDTPGRLALSPDQSTLYVLNEGSRTLTSIATRSMQENGRTAVGAGPRSLAVDPDNGYIYVACEHEGEVQVFSPPGLMQLSSLMVTAAPTEVVIAEFPRQVFVASSSQNRIFGFDLEGGGDPGSLTLCGPAQFLVYNPRSRQLFASVHDCREIAVLRPADGLEFAPLPMPSPPSQLAFDPGHRKLIVILDQMASLAIFDANRGTQESRIELGGKPYAVVAP